MHTTRLQTLAFSIRDQTTEADHFDMSVWANESGSTHCGTAACIGGEALLRFGDTKLRNLNGEGDEEAADLLGLNEETAKDLFYVFNWPEDLGKRYMNAEHEAARREVAADRIERFIDEHEPDD